MDAAVAEIVAGAIRDEANTDARKDIRTLQRQAVEAGRDRSRRLIKTSRIDHHTGEIRYNPAGRAMRDWYLHVYINTLRSDLGQPGVAIDAQQVEDMVRIVRTTQPLSDPREALQAVAVVRNVAVDDAAHAATEVVAALHSAAMRRAVLAVPDARFERDEISVQIGRHWYQRCYDNHVQAATKTQQPVSGVTHIEERHVASTLATGVVRRLIGTDGIPLVTAHDTAINAVDRRLAAGLIGVVPSVADPDHYADPDLRLRSRMIRTWQSLPDDERARWASLAETDTVTTAAWREIPGPDQDRLIRFYLDTHRPEYMNHAFDPPPLEGDPSVSAMAMFNHAQPLITPATSEADIRSAPGANTQALATIERTNDAVDSDAYRPGLQL